MEIQTRNPDLGDGWRSGQAQPAGLYGELPPIAALRPARSTASRQPLRKYPAVD